MSFLALRKNLNLLNLTTLIIISILFPAISLADANRVFMENSSAVVVIEARDKDGKPFKQGSGFIVRQDGAIVTNYHVISDAEDIKVRSVSKVLMWSVNKGLKFEGFLHIDKENDVVILKVKGEKLQTVKIGDIQRLSIGRKVYVIGSPQGHENTVSDGILSGIREIGPKRKIIQITAPVSEGCSGGPVFNNNGEVIGIATFLIKEAQNLNFNFAIPINIIKDKISAQEVIALKDAVIEDCEKIPEYWCILGYSSGEEGLYREAVDAFQQAIRAKPDYAEAHYGLGTTYVNLGKHREAMEEFQQAIRAKPDYAEAHYGLGTTYVNLGKHREAMEEFQQAIRAKPDYAEAHYGLGVIYIGFDKIGPALDKYKILKDLDPKLANELFNLIYPPH